MEFRRLFHSAGMVLLSLALAPCVPAQQPAQASPAQKPKAKKVWTNENLSALPKTWDGQMDSKKAAEPPPKSAAKPGGETKPDAAPAQQNPEATGVPSPKAVEETEALIDGKRGKLEYWQGIIQQLRDDSLDSNKDQEHKDGIQSELNRLESKVKADEAELATLESKLKAMKEKAAQPKKEEEKKP